MPRNRRLLWSVCIGHLTNDVFTSMVPVVLTFLAAGMLPMSNAQIGLAVSLSQLFGAVTQPFFGIQADRSGGRWIGSLGLVFHVCMFTLAILLAAFTRHYWLMFVPLVIATVGSGALASGWRAACRGIGAAPFRLQYGDLFPDGADRAGLGTRHRGYPA